MLVGGLALLSVVAVVAAQGATDDGMEEYERALVDYYGAVDFHPVLLPRGHEVGDVIDPKTLQVVWEKEK